MTFAKGASLEDPSRLFNSSLEGNTRRAIDIHEGEKINERALKSADPRRYRSECEQIEKESFCGPRAKAR